MLKIDISKDAEKVLSKLPPKIARQVATKIQALRTDPSPQDSSQLKGYAPLKRADQGEYRIIYRVDGDTLYIEIVAKRNDDEAYKRLARKKR